MEIFNRLLTTKSIREHTENQKYLLRIKKKKSDMICMYRTEYTYTRGNAKRTVNVYCGFWSDDYDSRGDDDR